MEHAVEVFPSTVETTVDSTQGDRPHGREYQEGKARALCLATFLGAPAVCLLLVLEGIDCEA